MNKVLFWDFHGTLTYPDSIWSVNTHKILMQEYPSCGISLDELRNVTNEDIYPWERPHLDYLHLREPNLWWEYVNQVFYQTYSRLDFSPADANRLASMVRAAILTPSNFRLYEDSIYVLNALSNSGWRHTMLSNNFPELEQVSENIGIAKFFDDFIVSALIGYEKPRKEIFDYALKVANYPDEVYMIGDNPISDIIGAKNAGIKSIQIGGNSPDATFRCAALSDILKLPL